METPAPLILTLQLDPESFQFFNALRQEHFPAARNFLQAHLTLFHHLPGDDEEAIRQLLVDICARQPTLTLAVTEVRNIGRGVAYKRECEALQKLHASLQRQWLSELTAQDKQKLWPHVTVQNKVPGEVAKQLQQDLAADFAPFTAYGIGFQLWAYQGGPWLLKENFAFAGS
ncbi:2'-5' RNA ligase family protein [Pontibacter sp. CAU 1760]